MTTDEQLQTYLKAACEAAQLGADVLLKWREQFHVREKGRFDFVTEADVESQNTIRDYLLQKFPEHNFLGEEDPDSQQKPGPDSPPTWIVDPLDGTTNYVHGCPAYCVSIGLQIAEEIVAGVIHDPSQNEVFRAAKGQGAWLGERRLQVSDAETLADSMLATGFPAVLRGREEILRTFEKFSFETQSLRRTGSTALNLAYVAAGRFDGFWALTNNAWDVAAGVILVQESGGSVTNREGEAYDAFRPDTVASNGRIHDRLIEMLQQG